MSLGLVVAVILIPVVLVLCFWSFFKNQSRSCAKRVGKRVAGVEVDYDSCSFARCNINPRVEIHGLTTFNPPGYSTEYALKVEKLVVDLNICGWLASLGKAIDISFLSLDELDIHLEFNQTGGSNLQEILKHLDKYKDKPQDIEEEGASTQHLLTTNPYAKGGVNADAILCHPRLDCCKTRSEAKVRAIEAKSICGTWTNSSSGLGGPFIVADLNIEDFVAQTGVTSYAQVVCAILQTLIVSALEAVPHANFVALPAASRHCCARAPEAVQPASPGSAWSPEKGRWIPAPEDASS